MADGFLKDADAKNSLWHKAKQSKTHTRKTISKSIHVPVLSLLHLGFIFWNYDWFYVYCLLDGSGDLVQLKVTGLLSKQA